MLTPELRQEIELAVTRAVASIAPRERLHRPSAAAQLMGVHHHTCLRLVREGRLRAVGAGRFMRIPDSAITEFFSRKVRRK